MKQVNCLIDIHPLYCQTKLIHFLLTCRKWSLETFCHNKMLLREGALFLRHVPFTMNLYIFESLKLNVEIFYVNIYHQRGEKNFNITYFDFVC